ncbi:Growth-Arrest-Specific Protein 2 domain protein [Opisthorchis viverrini]|uniref:Growth-Arrest-Specific Protein 2 domain protein n=1 Tax=Opisthorchis viverrini TaxID=6198 RepID=A0A1S8X239_OPIVI|nr:Growth-Arrest-Specific Protein 2 domain protein [Opisthorchis viverrini]
MACAIVRSIRKSLVIISPDLPSKSATPTYPSQMDQLLKVLQMSLRQRDCVPQCVWDFETLECTIEKMMKDTRRELGRDRLLIKKLTEALLQPDDGKLSSNGSEDGPEPNKLCQLLCDPLVKWDTENPLTIECYLNQCEAQLINATAMKNQVNSLNSHLMVTLSGYKKMFITVESCETSDNTSSLYDHSANTVVDSQATVDESDTISNGWSQESIRRDSALVLSSPRDSFTELNLDSHTDGDNADQLEAMLVLRRGRCRKLEEDFSQLKQLTLCRTENSRVLREALCETWRQNFLKWQTKRHFRVSDLFKAVLPVDTSSAQRSPGTTFSTDGSPYSEVEERCTNDCSTSSDIAIASPTPNDKISISPNKSVAFGSGKQRLKSATSLEHLGVVDKQELSLNIELTCSQFVQGVHRHRPEFKGSDCVSLRAAFAEIDKNRRGLITIKQLMDALQPERQFGPSSQLYLVRFLNSITMVRVGGGWQNLTEFLATRDPCRVLVDPTFYTEDISLVTENT